MEEVQSWWEVPSIAHFCYVFRSAFNLFFFEIAELESALLNIQDPDMSITLEQLVIKFLQGFYDEDSVNEGNWDLKLHELFNENLEDDENPFDNKTSFFQLTPRSKVEILFKLCELRLDVEGVLEEIKDIPSEDMQAKCLGKDKDNNLYWYFCDERLYKEDPSTGKDKCKKPPKNKNAKNTSNKKQASGREKRNKANLDVDKSWTVACYSINDWEKLGQQFSKSKSSHEKELCIAIKNHLPVIQEKTAEKDRLLRKRYLELAPKRTSSRISRVQEKKKMEELKAAEEARLAKIEAEKERAKKEGLMLKRQKESRQKRAEERHKAIEERAERAKLRELVKSEESDNSSSDDDGGSEDVDNEGSGEEDDEGSDEDVDVSRKTEKHMPSRTQKTKNVKRSHQESESEDDESMQSDNRRYIRTYSDYKQQYHNRRYIRTYSNYKQQSNNNESRNSTRLQSSTKNVKYHCDSEKSGKESDSKHATHCKETNSSFGYTAQNAKDESDSEKSDIRSPCTIADSPNNKIKINIKNHNTVKIEDCKQNSLILPNNYSNRSQTVTNKNSPPKVTVYKAVLQSTSDVSKWNPALDSKGQKLHILHRSYDNLASKRLKLEKVNFTTVSPNVKSPLSKENQIFKPVQTAFITYGKIIPSSSIVKLEYRKPPNPPVSS